MFWDRAAGVYDLFANVWNKKTHGALCAYVEAQISPADEVLECACGTGLLTEGIAAKCKRLVATDFSEKMLETLKDLQKNDVKICIATGRAPMAIPKFEGVEFDAFLTYNGSYCYDHEGTLYRNCIPSKDIETIVNNAVKIGRPVALATKDRMAANGKDQDLIDYYAFGNAEVEVAKDFEEVKKETVYQVLMGARKEEYQDILKGVQAAEITAWWNRAVDIIPINAGKGIGIEKVLKYYGIEKSQSMAFGDGNNDIEMLKAVGNGIAMGNASDDLKAVADEICGDVSEDGIYQYCLENELI